MLLFPMIGSEMIKGSIFKKLQLFRCAVVIHLLRGKKLNYKSVVKEISNPPFLGS